MDEQDARSKYRLMTSCIVPRPIAWVSTISQDGVFNAAPFSYFTGVSIEPPLVIIAVERRDNLKKDTIMNIEQTKEFVINIVTADNATQMNMTSKDFESHEDEFIEADLRTRPSQIVKPPAILESPIQMECVLDQMIEVGSSPHSLVIGEVKLIRVDDYLMNEGRIDMNKIQVIGRMGGKSYVETHQNLFELSRLDWRKKEV